MVESQEKVHETEVADEGNKQVVRERTSTSSTAETRLTLTNGIYFVLGVIEVLLLFRLLLKLLGANPASGFVNFVYNISGILSAPFRAIFSSATNNGDVTKGIFEPATLVAMIVYCVVAWGIVNLVHLNTRDDGLRGS
jgi:hypothetical protein